MGNQLSTVASKINGHPPKCLEVNIDARRGSPERFFLIPVTPLTMPTPQSPLCAMLNEALSAPSAVHWAWPPVSNVEAPCTGVTDDRLALTEASRAVPTVEQTFAHALPRQGNSRQDKNEGHAAAVELGHLLSFVAIECPVDSPIGKGHPAQQRGDRAVPQGQGEGASIFFDFSAEWLESIYQTEGCAVVGYFRNLNLFDLPKLGQSRTDSATATDETPTTPIVSVIDYYLFQGFCYEARAFMVLEAVSYYCKRFAALFGDRDRESRRSLGRGGRSYAPGMSMPKPKLSVLMRCRATNLPIVRLLQKLFRVYVGEWLGEARLEEMEADERMPDLPSKTHARDSGRRNRQTNSTPLRPTLARVRVTECANGEVLHLHLTPELVHYIATQLCDKVSTPGKRSALRNTCLVKFERGLIEPTPTPFDAVIDRNRERWLVENAPYRKHTCKSGSSDGGDGDCGGHETEGQRPLPLSLDDDSTTRVETLRLRSVFSETGVRDQTSTPSSISSGAFSHPSTKPRSAVGCCLGANGVALFSGPLSVGHESEILSVDGDHGWASSVTSMEQLDCQAFATRNNIRALPVSIDEGSFRTQQLRYSTPNSISDGAMPPVAARAVISNRSSAIAGGATPEWSQDQSLSGDFYRNRRERSDSTSSLARMSKCPLPLPAQTGRVNAQSHQNTHNVGQPTDYHQDACSFATPPDTIISPTSSITSPLSSLTGFPRLQPLPIASGLQEERNRSKTLQESAGRGAASDMAFLPVGTPIQVNNGDGLWICGYWLEASRPLNLHWFDPSISENALLQQFGPIWIRDLADENRLITPTSTGKVYVAVAPHVPVFLSPYTDGESVEVRALFERNYA
jgi:hypothetical protein